MTGLLVAKIYEFPNKLTNDTVELLESWDKSFTLLHKEKPTQEDKNKALAFADKATKKGQEVLGNITLKGHVGKIQRPESFISLSIRLFCLLIEQWVERNYKDVK